MARKPRTAAGYDATHVGKVRATLLYMATKIGDILDEIVIVGGIVPSLLIDQGAVPDRHVGTADLDVGLTLALLDHKRYEVLTDRLRQARFEPDQNDNGNPTRQRWRIDGPPRVTVDFLIAPTEPSDRPGGIKGIERDFAAIIAPGLRLAFIDQVQVPLAGTNIRGEQAERTVRVCGPAAFVTMKALAFRNRGENKDAYDLQYFIRYFDGGAERISGAMRAIIDAPEAKEAIAYLREDFATVRHVGPMRAAEFLHDGPNENAQADAWSAIQGLLDQLN